MPLGFGSGELADRMRRALDIRGRIPLAVDEVVVPVALVSEPQSAPFRISGRRCFAGSSPGAGGAGTILQVRIQNPTQVDALLDSFEIYQDIATGFTYQLSAGSGVALAAGFNLWTFEALEGGAVIGLTGLTASVSAPASPGIPGQVVSVGFSGTGSQTIFRQNVDLVIPPGGDAVLSGFATNVASRWAVSCRFFDDVPRLSS